MSKQIAKPIPTFALAILAALSTNASAASGHPVPAALIQCADARLAALDIPSLALALRDAGGRDCRFATLPWGSRVECERAERLMVAGIPVRSVSAEVTDDGVRRVVAVTGARAERLEAALATIEPAPGVERTIEAREDGASLVRCTVSSTRGHAALGAIAGSLPAPLEGSLGWQVCAVAASGGARRCVEVANEAGWRIDRLIPGAWRVRADPIGGSRTTCALAAERLTDAPGPVPVLLMRPFEVRAGSTTQAGELRIAYGSACRG
jgi:hypothetical protein